VISQDTSAYGVDIKYRAGTWRDQPYETRFIDLARGLGSLGAWVRMHYVYPYPHVDEVMPLMAERKVLPYLDIPFQHGSPSVLKRMRRPAHAENTLDRIKAWRDVCPDLVIRSTFIVGFPGETEAEFEELLAWLEEAQLDRVGCFKYSPVDGATSNALADHVAPEVQEERYQRFMELAGEISAERLATRVGKRMRVLVDSVEDGEAIARSEGDAPEIDGVVRIENAGKLKAGDWAQVDVISTDSYDLHARLVGN
jgi:ribosomal protein S12 methylthiotransferase